MARKREDGKSKADWLAEEVAKAVGAGKPWACETVDFNDPNRPPTCIEVDFPIIPINEIASIEASSGAATKPIYQVSKWWARRQSSVFRSMLLASALKAPDNHSDAAKLVWDAYYGNHQKKGAFKDLKVADIFMGGGTTIVEGSRLGMQMFGNDLNPVAWFVVKNEMAKVDKAEVEALLAEIEAEVKPQIMPFYTCDCPRGHKGKWIEIRGGKKMGKDFDPFTLEPEQRKNYRYEGPEIIYVFWAKHGPCQVTGCGHRTPIMSSPVMAVKEISTKKWPHECRNCGGRYNIEDRDVRLAPGVPLVVADVEEKFAVAEFDVLADGTRCPNPKGVTCPLCGKYEEVGSLGKSVMGKVELTLLVHPEWLKGESGKDAQGRPYGGSADDDAESTIRWNKARARNCKLIEVRGTLPDEIVCPDTNVVIKTGNNGGTVPSSSNFVCMGETCGRKQELLDSVKSYGKNGPMSMYAIQGYCSECDLSGQINGGRFFSPVNNSKNYDIALNEWKVRKYNDLDKYWPKCELSISWKTHGWAIPDHGYTHYYKMFNCRQLLQHSILLKKIINSVNFSIDARNAVLGAFIQFLRYSCSFTIWHLQNNQTSAFLSNNNFQMKNTVVETKLSSPVGDGSWTSASGKIIDALNWRDNPSELVCKQNLNRASRNDLFNTITGKTTKVFPQDKVIHTDNISCCSSTELSEIKSENFDIIITDPPFGEIMQYAELSDFFYVWLKIALVDLYPELFANEYTPKVLEAVSNPFRNNNSDEYYKNILTNCWKESFRILKKSGILSFTFHHDKDGPWVSVLESLFDAGFYVIGTFPIRSDSSKGEEKVSFGAEKVEYDVIHVCRKRNEEPRSISWAKLRRQVLQEVRDLKNLLEHHQQSGLPAADLQVIRRGKALEYFSRHYGKVFKDVDVPMTVLEALIGINQILEEEVGGVQEPPPHNAEPLTRLLLRYFDGKSALEQDQIQKFLRGSGISPSDFADRGWIYKEKKFYYLYSPLELAREWVGKHRKGMTSDYDQAMFLIGSCFEGSGINVTETLNNPNFKPRPALGALLSWFKNHGADAQTRGASIKASMLYATWASKHQEKVKQLSLFDDLGEGDD